LTHDFCPSWDGNDGQALPNDYSYVMWEANGRKRIKPTGLKNLPVKEYGGTMHPSLYDEQVVLHERPVDRLFLRFRNVNIMDGYDCLSKMQSMIFHGTIPAVSFPTEESPFVFLYACVLSAVGFRVKGSSGTSCPERLSSLRMTAILP
jgi:hypothetical protein